MSAPRTALLGVLAALGIAALATATVVRPDTARRTVWVVPSSPAPATPPPVTMARYAFDGIPPLAWTDLTGNAQHLQPVAGNRAKPAFVARDGGHAVRFPDPCTTEPCPRLVLRAPAKDKLNPGRQNLRFGAMVRLPPRNTSNGQNILQKGYSAEGSQYKLQVDGRAGHPSCVLVGDADRRVRIAVADLGVADGGWHRLECRRDAGTLTVLIDGNPRGSVAVPAALSITNDDPLSIGGKSAHGDNDQFHGDLDDVWIAMG
ncbi:LamG-like jellyroll fold domain-containing protein [Actinoplanes rectilineatus]|uniref:LamG-like jellyroll fold domain-containing protein n=1 Tax=Actinoplanes rectilineatus TaxID=113571 RepID=UPI0012F9AC19|nr:LamG-like jellyroll fold domain-containing protein [Actinoplanes rectilineatus]